MTTCQTDGALEVIDEDGDVLQFDDESSGAGTNVTSTTPTDEPSTSTVVLSISSLLGGRPVILGGTGVNGPIVVGPRLRGIVLQAPTTTATTTDTTVSDDSSGCLDSGDDLILLTQKKGGKDVVRGSQRSSAIDDRLTRLVAKLEAAGRTDQLEKLQERAAAQLQKTEERLQRTLDKAGSGAKGNIEKAIKGR